MNKPLRSVVFTLMLVSPAAALAQTPPPAPPAAPAAPAPATPAQELPPPPAGTAPPVVLDAPPPVEGAAPPAPLEDRVADLQGKVEGLDESLAATRSTADKLNKIKVSGYIQGRFEHRADSVNGVSSTGARTTTTQFLVRRGRLKVAYDGTNAEYMLQIDAVASGVTLKDAEATFVDTWTPFGLRLTVGQFKWPFGYEVLQSSGDREMPERAAVIRGLFPGERDRGLRLTGRYEWFRFAAALVNGTGTSDSTYPANDQNAFKDLVVRVGADAGVVVGGLSGYFGRTLATRLSTTSPISGTDRNMDGAITPDELTIGSATTTASYTRFRRMRLGADVQGYFDIPVVGPLALKGEFVYAHDKNLSFNTTAANSCLDIYALGWIITAVKNIGDYAGVVLRYDSYDKNFSKALDSSCTAQVTAGEGDRVDTLGGGFFVYGSGNIKATVTYEHIMEQSNSKKNDIFTAQLQARF